MRGWGALLWIVPSGRKSTLFTQRCNIMTIEATSTTAPSARRHGLTPRTSSSAAHTTRATVATIESTPRGSLRPPSARSFRGLRVPVSRLRDAVRGTMRGEEGPMTRDEQRRSRLDPKTGARPAQDGLEVRSVVTPQIRPVSRW